MDCRGISRLNEGLGFDSLKKYEIKNDRFPGGIECVGILISKPANRSNRGSDH
jgi:hypothetical protein